MSIKSLPTPHPRLGPESSGRPACAIALAAILVLGLAFIPAGPTSADILVMEDGSRVTTKGAWEVKGRQVIFTLPNGTLSAVRLSEVDLDASRAATDLANNPPPPPVDESASQSAPEPVLVLTNDDIGAGPDDVGGDDEDGDSEDSATTGTVAVAEWSYDPAGADPAYQLTGRLENRTGQTVENIQLYVDFIAVDAGTPRPDVHFLREARVVSSRLEPNESTDFRYDISLRDLQFSTAAEQFESPRVTFDVQYRVATGAPTGGDDGDEFEDLSADEDDIGAEGGDGEETLP